MKDERPRPAIYCLGIKPVAQARTYKAKVYSIVARSTAEGRAIGADDVRQLSNLQAVTVKKSLSALASAGAIGHPAGVERGEWIVTDPSRAPLPDGRGQWLDAHRASWIRKARR